MTFVHQGKPVTIQGDPSLSKELITAKSLRKLDCKEVASMAMLWMGEKHHENPQNLLTHLEEQLQ